MEFFKILVCQQCIWLAVFIVFVFVPYYANCSNSGSILNGQHLRIASLDVRLLALIFKLLSDDAWFIFYFKQVRPYMSIEMSQGTYRADGIVYQIIVWLSIRYNFT